MHYNEVIFPVKCWAAGTWQQPRAKSQLVRVSVKLFELGVHTLGGLFLGAWYAGGYRFSAFLYAKPSDFRHNFRPTWNDEDVSVVLDIRHMMSTQILNLTDLTDTLIIMKVMQSGHQTVRRIIIFRHTCVFWAYS